MRMVPSIPGLFPLVSAGLDRPVAQSAVTLTDSTSPGRLWT
jgi:hypothetical protein